MANPIDNIYGGCDDCGYVGSMMVYESPMPNGVVGAECPDCGTMHEPSDAEKRLEEEHGMETYERQQAPHLAAKYDELLEAVNDVVDELGERIDICEDTAQNTFTDRGRLVAHEMRGLEEARDLIENKVLEEHNE